jgi:hypothetical protein
MIKRYMKVFNQVCKFAEIEIEIANDESLTFLYQSKEGMHNLSQTNYPDWESGCREAIKLSRSQGLKSGYTVKRISGLEVDTDFWSTWIVTIKAIEELHNRMLISDIEIRNLVLGNKKLA